MLLLWPFYPDQNNQTTLQDLNDETKLQEVRDSTGLGKSQTAEVAWLDHLGLTYEEHDVGDFIDLFSNIRTTIGDAYGIRVS